MTNYLAAELRQILAAELRQILADYDTGSDLADTLARDRLLRLTEHVEHVADQPVEVDASTELHVSGLELEQEIRDRALEHAVALAKSATSGTVELLDIADLLAAYIRTGERPA